MLRQNGPRDEWPWQLWEAGGPVYSLPDGAVAGIAAATLSRERGYRVRRLHRRRAPAYWPLTPENLPVWIFDGHLDLAMNAISWNRDLTLPVHATRRLEQDEKVTRKGQGRGTVAYPEMRRGHVAVCIATVIARVQKPGNPLPGFRTSESAYAAARGQLAYYRMME